MAKTHGLKSDFLCPNCGEC
ncbi:MAG: DUF1610 domain-containing protein [bacterium]|nr:DUF1610 domain-containing protein [bacterium]MBK8127720.1 DUF1610 domain-containing protein [bacterium]